MIAIRLSLLLLFAMVAIARQSPAPMSADQKSSTSEPPLPVIDYDSCPGKNRIVHGWKIKRTAQMYSSWQDKRVAMGTLRAGEEVTVLAGVNMTRKPDRDSVTRPMPNLSLNPGGIFLRYDYFGEGVANIWAKGVWHKQYDLGRTTEKDGAGCQGGSNECDSVVIENGIKEWWVQVKKSTGAIGWMLSHKSSLNNYWESGNFDNLCGG